MIIFAKGFCVYKVEPSWNGDNIKLDHPQDKTKSVNRET